MSRFQADDRGRPRRRLIPDTPLVSAVTAASTFALAVVLFFAALPGEERVLVYEGATVGTGDTCESTGPDGETVTGVCVEFGEFETRETGWSPVPLVIALVLAAGGAVVVAGIPGQVRDRREQERRDLEHLTEDDFKGGR